MQKSNAVPQSLEATIDYEPSLGLVGVVAYCTGPLLFSVLVVAAVVNADWKHRLNEIQQRIQSSGYAISYRDPDQLPSVNEERRSVYELKIRAAIDSHPYITAEQLLDAIDTNHDKVITWQEINLYDPNK